MAHDNEAATWGGQRHKHSGSAVMTTIVDLILPVL